MARTKCPHCTYSADGPIAGHLAMLAGKLGHPAVVADRLSAGAAVCDICAYVAKNPRALSIHGRKHKTEEPAPPIEAIELPPVYTVEQIGADTVEVIPVPNREAWMMAAVEAFTPWFEELGVTLPAVRVSIGWPGGKGNKQHVVGQCWMAESVADRVPALFVSPIQQEPADVLETILHELIHAAGNRGHRGGFRKIGLALGFVDPMTSSPASPELKAKLAEVAEKLGPFPHSRIVARDMLGSTLLPGAIGGALNPPPVQGTRMLKVQCSACGYTVRTTAKWLAIAIPSCPVDGTEMTVEVRA